jgi:hypothetical protein
MTDDRAVVITGVGIVFTAGAAPFEFSNFCVSGQSSSTGREVAGDGVGARLAIGRAL